MNIEIERFTIDREYSMPTVIELDVPPWLPLEDLDLEFVAYGYEYDDADTMFGITESGDKAYTLRYGMGAIWFLECVVDDGGYTIVRSGNNESESVALDPDDVESVEQTLKRLREKFNDE